MSATETLFERWAEIDAVGSAASVLGWDQRTMMPSKGQASRGQVLSVLAGMQHDQLTDPALCEAIDAAAAEADDEVLVAQIREARRAVTTATAVPGHLARRLAEAKSRSMATWQQAKLESDFAPFEPVLAEVVDLTREKAHALVDAGIASTPYDALLDAYEPRATEAELAPLLADLRAELAPLVQEVADSGVVVDESPARGVFAESQQRAFATTVAGALGYDFEGGRLDPSAHPFTIGLGHGDVRITWRPEADDFRPGLFGVMHETGHALYEQGLPAGLARTPAGGYVSLGVHESQSRLWENQVGRSREFWRWALPGFRERFPDRNDVTVESMFAALHTVTPSLIRVEADEATYNLHIVARFEIERRIVSGEVAARDLPELWATTYQDLLGVRPESDGEGVLQDVHWSSGAFGYFPTYTLGNLMAAQLFEAAGDAIGDLPGTIADGDFAPLLDWLRENVHRHGSLLTADEIIERSTGRPLSSEPLMRHLRDTAAQVYGV